MEIRARFKANINAPRVMGIVNDAVEEGLLDTVVATASDIVHGSRVISGHNRRSIAYMVGRAVTRMGTILAGEKPFASGTPSMMGRLTAAIWSSSGYGGFLEIGTRFMAGIPYFKPAADRNFPNFARNVANRLKVRGG